MNAIDLSSFFQTKTQASDFSSRIASLSERIHETDFNLEKDVLNEFGLKKKDAFITLMRENNVSVDSNESLKQFFTKIQEYVTSLPILTLTVAFEPKEKAMKAFAEWFVLNSNKQVLFEINVDPSIIAGASISFNGKDTDLSIRPKFDKALQEFLPKKTDEKQTQTA